MVFSICQIFFLELRVDIPNIILLHHLDTNQYYLTYTLSICSGESDLKKYIFIYFIYVKLFDGSLKKSLCHYSKLYIPIWFRYVGHGSSGSAAYITTKYDIIKDTQILFFTKD